MRGAHYLWSDGERVHFWSAEGYDDWDDSGWAEHYGVRPLEPERPRPGPSGVSLPEVVADEYVMMRLAQLAGEGIAVDALDRAVAQQNGNWGAVALTEVAPALRAALAALQERVVNATGDASSAS